MTEPEEKLSNAINVCVTHACKPGCEHLKELIFCSSPRLLGRLYEGFLVKADPETVEDISWDVFRLAISKGVDGKPAEVEVVKKVVCFLCDKCDPTPLFFSFIEAFSDRDVTCEVKSLLLACLHECKEIQSTRALTSLLNVVFIKCL